MRDRVFFIAYWATGSAVVYGLTRLFESLGWYP
jgi:hypothetical protein